MDEATITREMTEYLRKHNPGPVIKHAEKSTLGIPDVSVTGYGHTMWIEVKLIRGLPEKISLRKTIGFQGPQYRTMSLLDYHGSGAMYVLFFSHRREWQTCIIGGVEMANLCNLEQHITRLNCHQGKAFEAIAVWLNKRREDRGL